MTTVPDLYSVEDRVVASIRALKSAQRLTTDEVRGRLAMTRSTWFLRMKDGDFTIAEVVSLAEYFRVSVQDMIQGIGLQPTDHKVSPKLALIQGEGRETSVSGAQLHLTPIRN